MALPRLDAMTDGPDDRAEGRPRCGRSRLDAFAAAIANRVRNRGEAIMQQRRMGRTGLKVSEICLGTMTFGGQCDEATSFRIMDAAIERGVTFFDTADVYPIPPDIATAGRTEEVIGRWLAAAPGRRRVAGAGDQVPGQGRAGRQRSGALAPAHPRVPARPASAGCETDYIDLYQSHSLRSGDADRRDRCAPSTTWSDRARSATWAARTTRPGSSRWRWG